MIISFTKIGRGGAAPGNGSKDWGYTYGVWEIMMAVIEVVPNS